MRYGSKLVTAPAAEILTLAEAKKQVEVATAITAHDTHLTSLIVRARQWLENATGRALITQTWDLYLDAWPDSDDGILLPRSPALAITSITYVDGAGDSQTWGSSNYVLSTSREPGRVLPAYSVTWPTARLQPDAIRVRYTAGYGAAASDVPDLLRQAALLLVAGWFGQREAITIGSQPNEVPLAVQSIVEQYRTGDEFACYGPAA